MKLQWTPLCPYLWGPVQWHHWATHPEMSTEQTPIEFTARLLPIWAILVLVPISAPKFPYFLADAAWYPTFWHQSDGCWAVSHGILFVFFWLLIDCLVLFDLQEFFVYPSVNSLLIFYNIFFQSGYGFHSWNGFDIYMPVV